MQTIQLTNKTYSFAKLTFQLIAFLRKNLIDSVCNEGVFAINLKFQCCRILHNVILTKN